MHNECWTEIENFFEILVYLCTYYVTCTDSTLDNFTHKEYALPL